MLCCSRSEYIYANALSDNDEDTNTWWPYFRHLSDYVRRTSYALTLGKSMAGLNAQSKGRRLGIFAPGGSETGRGAHGGREGKAGEGLRITWGASLPGKIARARLERASWEIAQDIHRALWAQHLAPSWSRVVGDPITLPFTWRRRRKRRRTPPAGKGS